MFKDLCNGLYNYCIDCYLSLVQELNSSYEIKLVAWTKSVKLSVVFFLYKWILTVNNSYLLSLAQGYGDTMWNKKN